MELFPGLVPISAPKSLQACLLGHGLPKGGLKGQSLLKVAQASLDPWGRDFLLLLGPFRSVPVGPGKRQPEPRVIALERQALTSGRFGLG